MGINANTNNVVLVATFETFEKVIMYIPIF